MIEKSSIAICVIAYNRPLSLKRNLEALSKAYYNENVTLIISIDKSENRLVAQYAENFDWLHGEKKVIVRAERMGLRQHVLSCGQFLKKYAALIVLEDDVTVAPSFYYYARQCVERYKDDEKIAGISLYNHPYNFLNGLPFTPLHADSDVYMMKTAQSWGQVWMSKQWRDFEEWYNNNSADFGVEEHLPKYVCKWPSTSWLKYHIRYCIENNKYFIYPYVSLSTNNSDLGTNVKNISTVEQAPMQYGLKKHFNLNPIISYDGFFENEHLEGFLNVPSNDICIDLYGEKQKSFKKRFYLSMEELPYKKIRSYALELKPWEMNIIDNREGSDIFLYDMNIPCVNKEKRNTFVLKLQYFYNIRRTKDIYNFFINRLKSKMFNKVLNS